MTTKNVPRYCQMSHRGQNHPWLGTSDLYHFSAENSVMVPPFTNINAEVQVLINSSYGPTWPRHSIWPYLLLPSSSLCWTRHNGFFLKLLLSLRGFVLFSLPRTLFQIFTWLIRSVTSSLLRFHFASKSYPGHSILYCNLSHSHNTSDPPYLFFFSVILIALQHAK